MACSRTLVATFLAGPRRLGSGSSLRFFCAAAARPFLPKACALACGKHLGLPSPGSLAQGPLMLPLVSMRTHLSFLNQSRRFSSRLSSASLAFFLRPAQCAFWLNPLGLLQLILFLYFLLHFSTTIGLSAIYCGNC